MTDDRQQPAAPAWRNAGIGHSSAFRCAGCNTFKGTLGRRMQSVRGLRTWVCAGCVGKAAAK